MFKHQIFSQELGQSRMQVCKSCDSFYTLTQQCKECWCFMPAKSRIIQQQCPLSKWQQVNAEYLKKYPDTIF